ISLNRSTLLILILTSGLLSSCNKGGESVDELFGTSGDRTLNLGHVWNFDIENEYDEDPTIDIENGVCRLISADQTDDDATCSGFGDSNIPNCGGSFSGVVWDSKGYL